MESITGQLVNKRPLSRRLASIGDPDGHRVESTVELVIKAGDILSEEDVRDLRDSLKLGDNVTAWGHMLPTRNEFAVHRVSVVSHWRDLHPRQAFQPRPALQSPALPQHCAKALSQAPERRASLQGHTPEGQTGSTSLPSAAKCLSGSVTARQQEGEGVCKAWINTGRCQKGAACSYAHPPGTQRSPALQAWVSSRRQARRQRAAATGDPHAASAASKCERARIFAEWLVTTFGAQYLRSGTGVVDVGGGRGDLAFYLQYVHGVPTTVVDPRPRPTKTRKQYRMLTAGLPSVPLDLKRHDGDSEASSGQIEGLSNTSDRREPAYAASPRVFTDGPAAFTGSGDSQALGSTPASSAKAFESGAASQNDLLANPAVGSSAGSGAGLPNHVEAEFKQELWERAEAGHLRACSLVVGLHPDQATEPILEFALQHGKPFAIIPCCVFPRQFPHRRIRILPSPGAAPATGPGEPPLSRFALAAQLPGSLQCSQPHVSGSGTVSGRLLEEPLVDSEERNVVEASEEVGWGFATSDSLSGEEVGVVTYSQLVQYIVQRGGHGTRGQYLPFAGRNVVLYRTGGGECDEDASFESVL